MPRSRTVDLVVSSSPDQVRARLAAHTRLRVFPAQARVFALGGKPFAGRVAADGTFRVAENVRDLWTRTLPVAVGRIEEAPGGARVHATVSFPAWLTWYMRVVWVALVGGLVTSVGIGVATAWAGPALPVTAALLFAVVMSAMAIGLHVSNADAKVDALAERLRAEVEGPGAVASEMRAREGEAAEPASARVAERPKQTT